jgi:mono/diheme cytochrome c family protein
MKTYVNRFFTILTLWCLPGLLLSGGPCLAYGSQLNATNSSPAAVVAVSTVRSISMPHFEPQLPTEPGRREFIAVCVGCHSPRYVTMQPPFARHQWEETVAKMVKVYGAPADEKQIQAIVDYLVMINGAGTQAGASAATTGDDDSDSFSSTPVPPDPEPVPVLAEATNAEEFAAELKRGTVLFAQDCAGCHGANGGSDAIVSQVLLPKPANLRASQFSVSLLSRVLWDGVPGSGMPSWRSLPQTDLSALVTYVRTLHPVSIQDHATPESLSHGQALFQKNCAACHGVRGDAKSAAALTLMPAPTNFKEEQSDMDYVLAVLRDGIPGTAMPPWKNQISESDRSALADFVRSLYNPVSPPGRNKD